MSGRTRLAPGGGCGGQWQQAYSGGVYSLHQTTDGGYLLAGDSNLELSDEAPLAPWLAKVDATVRSFGKNRTTSRSPAPADR